MTFEMFVGLSVAFVTLVTTLAGVYSFLRLRFLPWVNNLITHIRLAFSLLHILSVEFSQNGGSSLKEMVFRNDILNKILLDKTNAAIFYCNSKGECIYVNQAASDLFDMERADMLDKGWLSKIHEDDVIEVWLEWRKAIEAEIPYSMSFRLNNGKICLIKSILQKNSAGCLIGIAGTIDCLTSNAH